MKRLLSALVFVFIAAAAYADMGNANISPGAIPVSAVNPVINVYYSPGATGGFTDGQVAVLINTSFSGVPSLVPTDPGAISAKIMLNGTNPVVVDPANITIDGYAVTINAVTLNASDLLVITYGQTSPGGMTGPAAPGKYIFTTMEKRSGTGTVTQLDLQPYVYVSNMVMSKTCASNTIMAGNTVTYNITYFNSDTVNMMNAPKVWDTIPSGLMYLGASPAPSQIINTSGNSLCVWSLGTSLSASTGNVITITAVAVANLAQFGFTNVNTGFVSATGAVSNAANIMSASTYTAVQGMNLQSAITAMPVNGIPGNTITVIFTATNAGNLPAVSVQPSALSAVPSSGLTAVSTPNPSSISSLAPNNSYSFTWTFLASVAGTTYHFSSHFYADDNSQAYISNTLTSNGVTISLPTPTSTRTPTFTPTPTFTASPTFTQTSTVTQTFTISPTGTDTPVPAATNTQVVYPSATNTAISTQIATLPVTPVPTPIATPVGKVSTDRNYINTGKGDKVQIKYKVDKDGLCSVRIFNLSGEMVRNFGNVTLSAGVYNKAWDGTNDTGKIVGKGLYFIVVKQPGGQTTKKLVVIK
jgi:uncharacterized repeat protein (TIGR01451 family)